MPNQQKRPVAHVATHFGYENDYRVLRNKSDARARVFTRLIWYAKEVSDRKQQQQQQQPHRIDDDNDEILKTISSGKLWPEEMKAVHISKAFKFYVVHAHDKSCERLLCVLRSIPFSV